MAVAHTLLAQHYVRAVGQRGNPFHPLFTFRVRPHQHGIGHVCREPPRHCGRRIHRRARDAKQWLQAGVVARRNIDLNKQYELEHTGPSKEYRLEQRRHFNVGKRAFPIYTMIVGHKYNHN
jgi:hypothetical protein